MRSLAAVIGALSATKATKTAAVATSLPPSVDPQLLLPLLITQNAIVPIIIPWLLVSIKRLGRKSAMNYRGGNKGFFVLLSRTQAGPSRTVKQEQEDISRNHIQTFISPSAHTLGLF